MTKMIRRFLCLALAAMMMTLIPAVFNQTAMADTSLGMVTRDRVNFRVGPTMSDRPLFRLDKETVCEVLSEVDCDDYHWYEVIARDPENNEREYSGYIRGDCFRMLTDAEVKRYKNENAGTANRGSSSGNSSSSSGNSGSSDNCSETGKAIGYVQTIKGSVNIRGVIGGTPLTQVGKYETMPYLQDPVRRGNYNWYHVQLSDGTKGYVRGDCVRVVNGGSSGSESSSGSSSGSSTGSSSTGNSSSGSSSSASSSSGSSMDTPTGYVTTKVADVNIRKGIWGDLVTVCKEKGTTFPYYGEPRVYGNVKWYLIKGDFGYAYIHGNFVKAR